MPGSGTAWNSKVRRNSVVVLDDSQSGGATVSLSGKMTETSKWEFYFLTVSKASVCVDLQLIVNACVTHISEHISQSEQRETVFDNNMITFCHTGNQHFSKTFLAFLKKCFRKNSPWLKNLQKNVLWTVFRIRSILSTAAQVLLFWFLLENVSFVPIYTQSGVSSSSRHER